MELKKVIARLKPDEVKKFKSVLKVLKYTKSGFVIQNLTYTEQKDITEVSFEADSESCNSLVEKLVLNGVKLELNDEESSKVIEEANLQLQREKNKNALLSWKEGSQEKEKRSVDDITSEGNYEELIRITRDVSLSKEEIQKAASKIDSALNYAMEKAYNPAMQDQYYAENGLKRLLHIAGDSNLSLINKNDVKFKAGVQAINICVKHKTYNSFLVNICNNNKIDNLVGVTAALRLAGVLNESSYKDAKILEVVVKELNVKWLTSIFEGVKHKFEEKEIKEFKKLIKYVEEARSK